MTTPSQLASAHCTRAPASAPSARSMTRQWSKPGCPAPSTPSSTARLRGADLKSKSVPSTLRSSPVGICVGVTGRKREQLSDSVWSCTVRCSPLRFQYLLGRTAQHCIARHLCCIACTRVCTHARTYAAGISTNEAATSSSSSTTTTTTTTTKTHGHFAAGGENVVKDPRGKNTGPVQRTCRASLVDSVHASTRHAHKPACIIHTR